MRILFMLLVLFVPVSVTAGTVTFSWTPNNDGVTESYNLYYDKRSNLVTTVPEGTDTVTVDKIDDGKAHNYFLTAVGGGLESGNSVAIPVGPDQPADPGEPAQPGVPQKYMLILQPIQ